MRLAREAVATRHFHKSDSHLRRSQRQRRVALRPRMPARAVSAFVRRRRRDDEPRRGGGTGLRRADQNGDSRWSSSPPPPPPPKFYKRRRGTRRDVATPVLPLAAGGCASAASQRAPAPTKRLSAFALDDAAATPRLYVPVPVPVPVPVQVHGRNFATPYSQN
ncbi:hypothetical protein V9T40_010501 [Parthenolecanium corni]|uniref:Uncharacterized protein n=1 Tax=Parthenolecanium corni TaxID=536013 RepID=A0AAN9XYM6_9HEMI